MTPYHEDPWLTVYQGDCFSVLQELPAESVHCVVTSPPYWGLRDYGVADQIGLEATPEEYVHHLVLVFREVRRVLRPDGTLWLNLGDSYAGSGRGGNPPDSKWSGFMGSKAREEAAQPHLHSAQVEAGAIGRNWVAPPPGLKAKDLVGIPWRVAFALQADGWYLRSDIIWSKPNPMPESVTDRPTKSHEYLFLLSKSPRYYYDADAVAEPAEYAGPNGAQHSPYGQGFTRRSEEGILPAVRVPNPVAVVEQALALGLEGDITDFVKANNRNPTWQERKAAGATAGNVGVSETYQNGVHGAGLSHDLGTGLTRNLRSVWTVSTQPYPGAHFATFPRKLVEPCIKAGTSERGVCPECGAPWTRQIGSWIPSCDHLYRWEADSDITAMEGSAVGRWPRPRPAAIPATVLDPFAGSGTTGMVAQSLSRRAILIDLNADYLVQAMGRNRDIPLGLVG